MDQKFTIIQKLNLKPHIQGGFFLETYRSPIITPENRKLMTTIYYMLTKQSPVTCWHMNKSDIIHFHHKGQRLRYFVIYPDDARIQQYILSGNIVEGQTLQLLVPGNTWKACMLEQGQYSLISQAVAPGFEYEDCIMIESKQLLDRYPQHKQILELLQSKKIQSK